ncbi:MAG TPA: medium chain dehydrogenase/reductase family protein [Anaerolineales bacterium]|nr:medium chain dehydrogenase/reductase family protein [Anaerolineales bacterium]
MKYKSIVATRRGGPDVLEIRENELRDPGAGEVRIKVLATAVGRTDINYRYGLSPFSPKVPFVPGYEIVGAVDALGAGVSRVAVGERVAALTSYGGYTEVIYLKQEHLVPVPAGLDPAEAATLVLNYVSAYQMLHRVAKAAAGNTALVIGASGGVGTALLELGRLADLKMYGTASASKHKLVTDLGAAPIDYRSRDFVEAVRQAEPDGVDFVFDGMGGEASDRGLKALRRGGKLVTYAAPVGFWKLLGGIFKLIGANLRPQVHTVASYGITALYLQDKRPFMEDLPRLFDLLAAGKIHPVISARLPLLEARRANEMLEAGQVAGNLVLVCPES